MFQFATYIYAFLSEPCTEPGIIARLKAVEPSAEPE